MSLQPTLSVSRIKENLGTRLFGAEVLVFDEVESTNDLAKRHVGRGEGLILIADAQTQGKGRSGRSWHSPGGLGIYLSALLKPPTPHPAPLTLMAGVAGVSALKAFVARPSFEPFLKWPNDILTHNGKLAGILCEWCGGESGWLVIGIGINVNHRAADFPPSLAGQATSLQMETGAPIDRVELIRSLIVHLDREYHNWLLKGTADLVKKWSDHTEMFGKKITLRRGDSLFEGTAERLDGQGRLVVRLATGSEMAFDGGEATLSP
ncbi:MAG: biotin--[acetyl-CoA-carboxylase] ligase [Nitrospinales bacterium]